MKGLLILSVLILFVLVAALVAAESADYYTVVTDAGGAADVVTAANFAAAMQAQAGARFSGALDTDVASNPDQYAGKMLVYITGKDVRIVQGDAGNAPVVAAAESYFRQQGFSVSMGAPQATATPPPPPQPVQNESACDGCVSGSGCIPVGIHLNGQYCDEQKELVPDVQNYRCMNDSDCADGTCQNHVCVPGSVPPPTPQPAPVKQGVFARFFSWLASIFG